MEGVAVLTEAALAVLGRTSALGLDGDTALFCTRDGDLSMAGEAGERELDDVEEVAARFLGLLSFSNPLLAEVFLAPSVTPLLGLGSFTVNPCRGLADSAGETTLLLSAA